MNNVNEMMKLNAKINFKFQDKRQNILHGVLTLTLRGKLVRQQFFLFVTDFIKFQDPNL